MENRRRRIGLFGGSFDPPHNGHVHIADTARVMAGLDEVWWVVAKSNPFKEKEPMFDWLHRQRMIQEAVPNLYHKTSCQTNKIRTIDALRFYQKHYGSVRDFVLIMGGDLIEEILEWPEYDQIIELADICWVGRGGYHGQDDLFPSFLD